MRRIFASLLPYVAPAAIAGGFLLEGLSRWTTYAGVALVFAIHPLLDGLFGVAAVEDKPAPLPALYSSLLLWLYVPVQLALLVWTLGSLAAEPQYGVAWIGKMLSIGALNGAVGITVAHELVHRRRRAERGLGVALLLSVCYAHFRVEHVFGHHRLVATPRDPGSARRSDNLYTYWRRALPGEWLSAWRIESARIASGRSLRWSHRVVQYAGVQALLLLSVGWTFGAGGCLFFMGQSLLAVLLLQAISFVEHWGLERRELTPGRFEAVQARHAWDSRHRMTNGFLFHLGRHAHHHLKSAVPYQELQNVPAARVLPFGYSTMLVLALWPQVWRSVMLPRLDQK